MPGATSFRQAEEKPSSFVIDLMLWSPKMDLIAVTAVTGEVSMFVTLYELLIYLRTDVIDLINMHVCRMQISAYVKVKRSYVITVAMVDGLQ